MESEFDRKVRQLREKEPAYTAEAYRFVADAVTYTVKQLERSRHVSALELLKGARALAQQEYGAVAKEVLQEFGLFRASDVGKVVYLLIGAGLLSASPEDHPEDFDLDMDAFPEPETEPEEKIPAVLPQIDG